MFAKSFSIKYVLNVPSFDANFFELKKVEK